MKNVAEKKYVGTSYHGVPIPWRTADTNGTMASLYHGVLSLPMKTRFFSAPRNKRRCVGVGYCKIKIYK